jgi:Na+/H+-translocating membrane pyrophosphatase
MIVVLAGQAGATFWLLGAHLWAPFFLAAALGLMIVSAAAYFSLRRQRWGSRPTSGTSRSVALAEGLGSGLAMNITSVLALGLLLVSGYVLGESSGMNQGGLLGMAFAGSGVASMLGYMLALSIVSPTSRNAMSVGGLTISRVPEEAQVHAQALDSAAFGFIGVGRTFFVILGVFAALIATLSLPFHASGEAATAAPIALFSPPVLFSGALGASLVLVHAGRLVLAASRGARAMQSEVRRQLKGKSPKQAGETTSPVPFTPNYSLPLEEAEKATLSHALFPTLLSLLAPVVLAFSVRLLYADRHTVVAEALSAFATVACLTGLGLALVADGVHAITGQPARRRTAGVVEQSSFAGFVSAATGPSVSVVVKPFAIISLALGPIAFP